jgi:predicted regulator of amino acid metabolism with ACT domain
MAKMIKKKIETYPVREFLTKMLLALSNDLRLSRRDIEINKKDLASDLSSLLQSTTRKFHECRVMQEI